MMQPPLAIEPDDDPGKATCAKSAKSVTRSRSAEGRGSLELAEVHDKGFLKVIADGRACPLCGCKDRGRNSFAGARLSVTGTREVLVGSLPRPAGSERSDRQNSGDERQRFVGDLALGRFSGGFSDAHRCRLLTGVSQHIFVDASEDSDPDPVMLGRLTRWGKPPRGTKNQGQFDYYCFKTFYARFSIEYRTMECLKDAMGKSIDVRRKFVQFRGFAVKAMLDAGCWEVRIQWGLAENEAKRVLHHQEHTQAIDGPEDIGLPFLDYVSKYGDPATNGKGHERKTVEGVDMVVIPGERIWKIRRTRQLRADAEQVVDDGKNMVGENQLQDNFVVLAQSILMPEATGVTADLLFGTTSLETPSSRVTHAPVQIQTVASNGASSAATLSAGPSSSAHSVGWGFSVASKAKTAPQVVSPTKDDVAGAPSVALEEAVEASGAALKGGGSGKKARGKAKSKSQSKAEGKAAAGQQAVAGGSGNGRGRPKRDLKATAEKFLEAYVQSDPDSSYFKGKEQHVQKIWIEALAVDLDKFCIAGDSAALILQKKVHVVSDMTKQYRSSGCSSAEFAAMYDEFMHFLSMEPVAQNPLPVFMRVGRHENLVSHATNDAKLPELLSNSKLLEVGYAEEDLDAVQVRLLRDVVIVKQQDSAPGTALQAAFGLPLTAWADLSESARTQAHAISVIVGSSVAAAPKDSEEVLSTALAVVGDASMEAAFALSMYPTGRAMIAQATTTRDILKKVHGLSTDFTLLLCALAKAVATMQKNEENSVAADSVVLESVLEQLVKMTEFLKALGPSGVVTHSIAGWDRDQISMRMRQVVQLCFSSFRKLEIYSLSTTEAWLAKDSEIKVCGRFMQTVCRSHAYMLHGVPEAEMSQLRKASELLMKLRECVEPAEVTLGVACARIAFVNSVRADDDFSKIVGWTPEQQRQCATYYDATFSAGGFGMKAVSNHLTSIETLFGRVRDVAEPLRSTDDMAKGSPEIKQKLGGMQISADDVKAIREIAGYLSDERYKIHTELVMASIQAARAAVLTEELFAKPDLAKLHIPDEAMAKAMSGLMTALLTFTDVVRIASNFGGPDGLFGLDKPLAARCPVQMGRAFEAGIVCPLIAQQGKAIYHKVFQHFVDKSTTLVLSVASWMPEKWAVFKANLLDDTGPGMEMAKTLLSNDHYPKLSSAAESLKKLNATLSQWSDKECIGCLGVFAPEKLLSDGQRVATEAVQCASYTYLTYMLKVHVPEKTLTEAVRVETLKSLRQWVDARESLKKGLSEAFNKACGFPATVAPPPKKLRKP